MEEILASIRRIISEDDAPAAEGQAEAAAPAPEPAPVAAAPEPQPQPEPEPESPALMDETPSMQAAEEDVLELTEKFEEPAPVETIGDIDIAPRAEAPAPAPAFQSEEPAPFVAPTPQFQAGSATSTAGGTTIEDLVRSILEPKIREWADQNLESIMRDIVREKLDRVFK